MNIRSGNFRVTDRSCRNHPVLCVCSTVGGVQDRGGVQYRGVFSTVGVILSTMGDILSTMGDVQYRGGLS